MQIITDDNQAAQEVPVVISSLSSGTMAALSVALVTLATSDSWSEARGPGIKVLAYLQRTSVNWMSVYRLVT